MATISDDLAAKLTAAFNQSTIDIANQDALLTGSGDVTITLGNNIKKTVASWAKMQAATTGKADTGSANTFTGLQTNNAGWIVTGGGGSSNGLVTGSGDGASYDNCNIDLASWQGIGIYNTSTGGLGKIRTGFINARTGSLSLKGSVTASSLSVSGAATIGALSLGSALPITQGGTGATTAATARKNLGLGYTGVYVPGDSTGRSILRYDDSGLMIIAKTMPIAAVGAGATNPWSWNWKNELGVSFAAHPNFQVTIICAQSTNVFVGTEGLNGDMISGFVRNAAGGTVSPIISLLLIGLK